MAGWGLGRQLPRCPLLNEPCTFPAPSSSKEGIFWDKLETWGSVLIKQRVEPGQLRWRETFPPQLHLLAAGDGCHWAGQLYVFINHSRAVQRSPASETPIYLAARPEPELPSSLASILLCCRQLGLLLFLIECF